MLALVLHVAGWVFYPTIPSEPTVRFAWSLPPSAADAASHARASPLAARSD